MNAHITNICPGTGGRETFLVFLVYITVAEDGRRLGAAEHNPTLGALTDFRKGPVPELLVFSSSSLRLRHSLILL